MFSMVRRWSLFLLAVNSCLSFFLIGTEEFRDWQQYEYWQLEEQRSQRAFSPVLSKEAQQAMSVDYWPNARIRTFHTLNLPTSALLGWYSHPLSIQTNSILGPSLLRVTRHLSVKGRVATLDVGLLLSVCLQWWLVGVWLEHPVPFVRVLRVVAAGMTVLGIVMTLLAVPRALAEIAAIPVGVLSLVLVLAWVFLIVIGTLSGVLKGARTLRAASQRL
ncbi:MAG TPA: hypothetical protein VMG31_15735 [Verrucomicrobiae bacterium]|nr:hypothetical protein [Verrucomicrobiae bacterium]